MRPSIIAEEASSIPATSPAAKIPGMDVAPVSSQAGMYPPRVSAISTPSILSSCVIGERPTATQMVSTSKCFSVPGMNWYFASICAIVTPLTQSVPSASLIVWER